jgi:cardiolipin synthase
VENNLQLFLSLLYSARDRIIITSPYFVPDDSMLRGLLAATARGVHVELFVSEIGDQGLVWHAQRSYYQALLDAGSRSSATRRRTSCTRSTSASTTSWR